MSEAAPISSQSAPHRGRGGRRGRAGRGRYRGSRRSDSSSQEVQTTQPQPVMNGSEPVVVASQSEAGDVSPHRGGHPGRGRGDRGRQAGGRRGRAAAGQRSIVISHRGGRGPPAVPGPAARVGSSGSTALRAAAPEFVPGQPVLPSSSEPQAPAAVPKPQVPAPRIVPKSTAADLPTRIHEDIDNRQYECVICTNDVLRSSKVWSCSICWTVAHLHCVKKWHTNQVKERDENQRPNQPEGWRCPGCNSTLIEPPGPYRCWCGKDIDPKPIPGLPPHTCGQTCSKSRATCPHQCSLMCHAGPCPPCTLMGPTQTCFCGKKTSTKRCSETDYGKGWSCHEPCGDMLPCGEHYCSQPCHAGLCGACEIPVPSACYCGKDHREIPCNQRDDVLESFDYGQLQASESNAPKSRAEKWFEGSFRCGNVCNRTFDCGNHSCQKACHPQDELVAHCPFSPDVVTHCPCGKTPLSSMSAEPRKSCQDPVPRCDKPCNKVLACGHLCQDKCHTGSCAPCTQIIDITCRCGRTTGKSACHQGNVEHPLCFRVCRAQLNCGRHECGERCCSGEKKAAERRKQKRNANENYEPEHICLQVCGRQLKCGKHTCQQLCHKGPCMSCPEAIFDEISCSCGRTVLQPPQPCGTRPPECRFPCTRARPCGHPSVHHQCHSDETACPKCPFLVEKLCVCGKKTLKNQPCWFEEARCGLPCGKKLKCGAHECRKPCHKPGECEDVDISGSHCSQPCGKVRKSCDHTCADQCHAPYPCKEDKPCQSKTFRTCPCQHRKQEVRCQATKLNPWPNRESTLKCDDECLRLQRNRQLAEALNIDPETHSDDHIPYSDTTLKLFRENVNWAQTQEREFRVFAAAPDEKRLRFKPMQAHQRAFLHALAEDFGLDSESQDPEPHRHVCVFKTPRFVSAPRKTLAQCLRIAKAASNLGTGASGIRTTPLAAPGPRDSSQVFNALLLRNPRFGLTIDELDAALATDLAKATTPSGSLTFTTSFLPSAEEVLIKAAPNPTAAASAPPPTPQAVESALTALKPAVARTISRQRLAGAVLLCHVVVDDCRSMPITRREGDGLNGSLPGGRGSSSSSSSSGDGWSAVASRGSWRRTAASRALRAAAQAGEQERAPSAFVALRKGDAARRKKEGEGEEVVPEEMWGGEEEEEVGAGKKGGEQRVAVLAGAVAEDWLAAVEEEERLGSGNGSVSGVEGTVDVAAAAASAEDGVDDVKGDGSEVESKGETAQGKELESPETAAAAAAAAEGA